MISSEPVLTVPDPLTAKISPTKSTVSPDMSVLSQAIWIPVMVVTLGSILALTLWFVIFRRQAKSRGATEDPLPELETLQTAEANAMYHPTHSDRNGQALQREANGHSSCHQLHLGTQMDPKWEDGFSICPDAARDGCRDGSEGLPSCSSVADHRVPLPATELGGTALVTTKTV
uniref:Uncharacterized protein n=1 Tax=Cyprinodon variegatus TaxID=28743 RepID=A0A3Q2FSC8_CYPVA